MSQAFVGSSLWRWSEVRREMASAFSGARQEPAGLERGALRSAARRRIALFVAPGAGAGELLHRAAADGSAILAGRRGDDVHRHPHRVAGTNSGRSAWFVGVLVLMVYAIFAMTLYLLPPEAQ
jgi:Ca2+:H+ antiporter